MGRNWQERRGSLANGVCDGLSWSRSQTSSLQSAILEDLESWETGLRLRLGVAEGRAIEASLGDGFVWGGQVRVDTSIKRLCFSYQFRTG